LQIQYLITFKRQQCEALHKLNYISNSIGSQCGAMLSLDLSGIEKFDPGFNI